MYNSFVVYLILITKRYFDTFLLFISLLFYLKKSQILYDKRLCVKSDYIQ